MTQIFDTLNQNGGYWACWYFLLEFSPPSLSRTFSVLVLA